MGVYRVCKPSLAQLCGFYLTPGRTACTPVRLLRSDAAHGSASVAKHKDVRERPLSHFGV